MKSLAVAGAVLALALLAVTPSATTALRAATASPPTDIEVAVDTTGSMDVSIQNAKTSAAKLVAGLLGLDANARLAIVSFRDPGNPGGEYQVLQPMTTDSAALSKAIGELHTVHNPTAGNVAEESYNLVFHSSYSDSSIGWRPAARKLVVVIGDAEPYGAGKAGLAGCRSQLADPHGFNTAHELDQMATSGRTLLMVRESSHATTASLACYQSMAARSFSHGIAVNDTGDIGAAVVKVVQVSLTPVEAMITPVLGRTHALLHVSVRVRNPNAFSVTVQQLTVTLASGFSASPGPLSFQPNVALGAGKTYAASLTVLAPTTRANSAGTVTATVAFPDGNLITPATAIRANVGSSFVLHVTKPVGGTLGALSLVGARAHGQLTLRSGASVWRVRPTSASILQRGARTIVTLGGTWQRTTACGTSRARLRLTLNAAFAAGSYRGLIAFVPPCGKRSVTIAASTSVGV
jgi:hypothetical protein